MLKKKVAYIYDCFIYQKLQEIFIMVKIIQ